KFEMAKRQLKQIVYGITAHSVVGCLSPTTSGQTNIRPMQVRQKRAVFARIPSKQVKETRNSIRLRGVHRRRSGPSCSLTLIEPEHGANFFVDFQFTKVGRLLGPLHIPPNAPDEITFVNPIPYGASHFHKQKPAQSRGEPGSGKL